jgi:hypothetical protein
MGVSTPKFVGLTVTLTETQRNAAINSTFKTCRDARVLEEWLEAQPQCFVMLGINAYTYNVIVWVMSQFLGPVNSWWLNRKHQASIPYSFYSLVAKICKTSQLPNIRDDAISAPLALTQATLSYASYTQLFNDFQRMSRQPLTYDLQCVRFINGLANFELRTQAKSHRSQLKGNSLPLVELQTFRNDLVT